MALFTLGDFTLHSGAKSSWKIDCDALTNEDWEALALMAAEKLRLGKFTFKSVVGVPEGGLMFAWALEKYTTSGGLFTLIADDVFTTGASLGEVRKGLDGLGPGPRLGVVVFARGPCPSWVIPLFQM